MANRKGKLASRSLEYHAPPVPSFLRALQAQVSSSQRYSASGTSKSNVNVNADQLDTFVSATSKSGKRKVREQDQEPEPEASEVDSEDEMHGAQVVVLNHDKHLSHSQALEIKKSTLASNNQTSPSLPITTHKDQPIASTAGGTRSNKRRTPITTIPDPIETRQASISSLLEPSSTCIGKQEKQTSSLDHVKQLIQSERASRSIAPSSTPANKEQTKQSKRNHKNAQARKLKAQSGKRLSFDLSDA